MSCLSGHHMPSTPPQCGAADSTSAGLPVHLASVRPASSVANHGCRRPPSLAGRRRFRAAGAACPAGYPDHRAADPSAGRGGTPRSSSSARPSAVSPTSPSRPSQGRRRLLLLQCERQLLAEAGREQVAGRKAPGGCPLPSPPPGGWASTVMMRTAVPRNSRPASAGRRMVGDSWEMRGYRTRRLPRQAEVGMKSGKMEFGQVSCRFYRVWVV